MELSGTLDGAHVEAAAAGFVKGAREKGEAQVFPLAWIGRRLNDSDFDLVVGLIVRGYGSVKRPVGVVTLMHIIQEIFNRSWGLDRIKSDFDISSRRLYKNHGLVWSVWKIAKTKNTNCHKAGQRWVCVASAKACKYVPAS